jgi:hypothetical protein
MTGSILRSRAMSTATVLTVLGLLLGGCGGAGAPVPTGQSSGNGPGPNGGQAAASPAVSLSEGSGTGEKGTLVAHYDNFVLAADGGGIKLEPGGVPQVITGDDLLPQDYPDLTFVGLEQFNGSLYGVGAVSFAGCVLKGGLDPSGTALDPTSQTPAGLSFCYTNKATTVSGEATTGLIGLITIVGYRLSDGSPDPDPADDQSGSVVVDVSVWSTTTYPCTGAVSDPQAALDGKRATYDGVVIPAGNAIAVQAGLTPRPVPECAPAGYDLGYDGGGAFSSSTNLLKLNGSQYQSCLEFASDPNSPTDNEDVAGAQAGDTLCFATATIKVVSSDAASATVDITISGTTP